MMMRRAERRVDLLVRMQLWMDGQDIGETNVVAGSDAGQHGGHVVEQHLDGTESRTARIRRP